VSPVVWWCGDSLCDGSLLCWSDGTLSGRCSYWPRSPVFKDKEGGHECGGEGCDQSGHRLLGFAVFGYVRLSEWSDGSVSECCVAPRDAPTCPAPEGGPSVKSEDSENGVPRHGREITHRSARRPKFKPSLMRLPCLSNYERYARNFAFFLAIDIAYDVSVFGLSDREVRQFFVAFFDVSESVGE